MVGSPHTRGPMPLTVIEAVFLALAMVAYAIAGGSAGFDLARRRRDSHAKPNPLLSRGVLLAGFGAHAVLLAVRGFRLGDHALADIPSTLLFVAFCATLVGVIIDAGQGLRSLSLFLAPPVVLALALAAVQLARAPEGPSALPADAKLALRAHIVTVVVAYGAFTFAAVLSAMYLYLEGQLKKKKIGALFDLPALDRLERVEGRFVVAGFVLLTVSMALGLATQRATGALGVGWLKNAQILTALVTWVFCGGLVAGRAASLLAGRRQIFATLIVFVLVLVTYLGAPFLSGTAHFTRTS
jgi:ABC-type uncharacterized transport system permease subunit